MSVQQGYGGVETPTAAPSGGRFCPECGQPHARDAHFCETCGHRLDVEPAFVPPQPARGRGPGSVVALLVAFALVLAVTTVVLVVVLSRDDDEAQPAASAALSAYTREVDLALDPLGAANTAFSDTLAALEPGDEPDAARSAARRVALRLSDARSAIRALAVPEGGASLRRLADTALAREASFIAAARRALRAPTDAAAADLGPRARVAREAWDGVQRVIPGAGGRIANVDALAAWARAEVRREERQNRLEAQREARERAEAEEARRAEEEEARRLATTRYCGGYEGIVDVTARGVDCETALGVAAFEITGMGSSEGFSCRTTGTGELDAKLFSCTREDGAEVTFGAFIQ